MMQAPPAAIRQYPQYSQDPRHARVAYTQGLLFVSADNSSLNQILRQISHETGMKISGGVADERVFGRYGPSAPSQVLAALLDGTGSNMLLLHRNGNSPAELVLTPRQDGPTPPPPTAPVFNESPESAAESETARDADQNQALTTVSPPASNGPPVSSGSTGPPPAATNVPLSPNGVKTPQQIYDQLERLRLQATPQ